MGRSKPMMFFLITVRQHSDASVLRTTTLMASWNRTVGDKLKGVSSNPIILKRRRFRCREVK